jgi:hypothetical protein
LGLWTRNQASKLLNIPWLADWAVRSEFRDDIAVPEFAAPTAMRPENGFSSTG